jgi:hypothetical protein
MFNFCLLTGIVITLPTLSYFGVDNPVTDFDMIILLGKQQVGRITVLCSNRQAMRTIKYVNDGVIVVAAGFISESQRQGADGVWSKKLILNASQVEVLDRKILWLEQKSLFENLKE